MPSGKGNHFLLNQPIPIDDCQQLDAWGAITGWQSDYQQVGRGKFDGRLTVGFQGDFQINRCVYNRELLIHASPPKGMLSLVVPYSPGRRGLIQGRELEHAELVVVPCGAEGFLRTANEIAYFVIMVPQAKMLELMKMNSPEADGLNGGHVATFPEAIYRSVKAVAAMMLEKPGEDARHLLTEALMDGFCHQLEELSGPRRLRSRLRYVKEAKDYFEDRLAKGATLSGASAELGVNRRTLELAFKDVLDMSPLEYLRTRQLQAIRRTLSENREEYRSNGIGELAKRFGMTHAGHFSREYKAAFGELPRETVGG